MKNLLIAIILMCTFGAFGQSMDSTLYKLQGKITKLRNSKGVILLEIVDKDKKPVKSLRLNIVDKVCTFDLGTLPKGSYAINYFHDENENNKFDSNFMGIPKEGYGFSNNATAMFSAPDFKDRIFLLNEDKSLNLKIKYML